MEKLAQLYVKYEEGKLLQAWKNFALWTIPAVFPHTDQKDSQIQHDYQSMGAILVNNLAAKLVALLFPVNQAFIKIQATEALADVLPAEFKGQGTEMESNLAVLETDACKRLFLNASYAQLIQAMRYLIITGNCLLWRTEGKLVVYGPKNFVTLRDNTGDILCTIIRESMSVGGLPRDIRSKVPGIENKKEHDSVMLYTKVAGGLLPNGRKVHYVTQEIEGVPVGKPSTYTENACPYVVCTWNLINGDSYGRGHVEDHSGDLAKLSDLSRALTIYEIQSCKVVNLVKPGSTVDVDSLNDAEDGEWVQADPAAVGVHEGGEYQKIQQINADIQMIFQRLSTAFMYRGNTREGERVTAEEIRTNAEEADRTLGGTHSHLAQAMQLPLGYLLVAEEDPKFMGAVIAGGVSLEILTGIPALGRASKVTAMLNATQILAAMVPALQQISSRLDKEAIVDMVYTSFGMDLKEIMLSEEELKAEAVVQQNAAAAANPMDTTGAIQGIM